MSAATILVVEDDPAVRSILTRMLRAEGHQVLAVDSGEAALAFLREGRDIQLVLLDVGLPGISGFDTCALIKTDPAFRLIPVVMVTGHDSLQDRLAAIDAGADDFLAKPFEHVELMARTRSLLRLKAYTDQLEDAEAVLLLLAQCVEARDPYTAGHCDRLSRYSVALGERLGLDLEQLQALSIAGVVHDLGKIATPDAILLKRGPLTPSERRVIEEHPGVGEELCKPIRSFALVRPIIRHHHERWDGSGYPDGLRGIAIPVTARILAVVDVFDALTTERPYRKPSTAAGAIQILEKETERGWYDPEVVAAFREVEA